MDFDYYLWLFFRYLFIVLVFVFLLGGFNDFLIDISCYLNLLYRKLFKSKLIRPLTLSQIHSIAEKPIAIMIPAWKEANVIKKMLINTIGTLDYKNFYIFVGTYPNDLETQREIEKVREIYQNVIKIVNPLNGPTNKADCLNCIYRSISLFERQYGLIFEIIVIHDAEDIVHPLTLKLYNYLMPRMTMIQLPVLALEVSWHNFTGGVYMDEFAELHLVNLWAREKTSKSIPCAGVGAAFLRKELEELANRDGFIFNTKSLTEDYEIGIRLSKSGKKLIILHQILERIVTKKSWFRKRDREVKIKDLIAIHEYFPNKIWKAVRQRARWIYGINIQGLKYLGWADDMKINYFLFHDRIALLSNIFNFMGYLVFFYWAIIITIEYFNQSFTMPPLVATDEIYWKLTLCVLFFLFWRIINRAISVYRIYGFSHAILSPIRIVHGNFINFLASIVAIKWFIKTLITKKEPGWEKTEHEFPTEKELHIFRTKIGDLLLKNRVITSKQLEEALKEQKETKKKLGEILLQKGYLVEEDLTQALAIQNKLPFAEIDPYNVDPQLLEIVSREIAERYHIFPLRKENNTLMIAIDRLDLGFLEEDLAREIDTPVKFYLTTSYDINFAIERAYSPTFKNIMVGKRLGESLLNDGKLTEDQLKTVLREQKRTGKHLGEILVQRGIITGEKLNKYLEKIQGK